MFSREQGTCLLIGFRSDYTLPMMIIHPYHRPVRNFVIRVYTCPERGCACRRFALTCREMRCTTNLGSFTLTLRCFVETRTVTHAFCWSNVSQVSSVNFEWKRTMMTRELNCTDVKVTRDDDCFVLYSSIRILVYKSNFFISSGHI